VEGDAIPDLLVNFSEEQFLTNVLGLLERRTSVRSWSFSDQQIDSSKATPQSISRLHELAWLNRYTICADHRVEMWPRGSTSGKQLFVDLCLDRVFIQPISQSDKTLYISAIRHLLQEELKVLGPFRRVIWSREPHFVWDIILSGVIQRKGIPQYALAVTQLGGRFCMVQIEDGTRKFIPLRNHPSLDQRSVFTFESAGKPSIRLARSIAINRSYEGGTLFRILKGLAFTFYAFGVAVKESWRQRRISELQASQRSYLLFGNFQMFRLRLRLLVSVFRLDHFVRQIARDEELKKRELISFFLHYQPELSTDPEGGEWRFQLRAICHLRQVLNALGHSSFTIVVKEHPRQLSFERVDLRTRLFRQREFYKAINEMDGVVLISPSVDSTQLIKNSILVATVNGSAAWEAALLSRPSVTFVPTWHSDCSASKCLLGNSSDVESVRSLLALDSGDIRASVEAFLAAERVTREGAVGGTYLSPELRDQVVEQTCSSLLTFLNSDCRETSI